MTESENFLNEKNGSAGLNGVKFKTPDNMSREPDVVFEDPDTVFEPDDKITVLTEDIPFIKSLGSPYYPNGGPESQTTESIQNYGDFITFGNYTILFMIMYEFLMLPQMGNMTFMVYGAYTPQVVSCGNHSFEGMVQRDVCAQLPELMNRTGCQPSLTAQFGSLGYELGYYCSQAQLVKRAVSIQMIGVFLGAPIFGQASDWWGRRKVMGVCFLVICILDIFVSRAPDLWSFTAVYTINMIFIGGTSTIMHVYIVENVPKRHRVWIMMLLSFSPNMILFAGLAYVAQEWRALISIAGYLTIPAMILLFMCFESPRWIIENGQFEEAERVIRKIEKWNGTLTEERSRMITELIRKEAAIGETRKKKKQKYYMHHIFYTAQMASWTLTLSFGLFCVSLIAFAMVFNMEQFSGSIFMNSALLGCFRVVLNLILGASDYVFPKLGRKVIYQGSVLYVIVMLSFVAIMKGTGMDYPNLTTIVSLSATGLCSQLFVVKNVIIAELFPTAVRNIAASFASTMARFGGVLSPNLFLLESIWIGAPYLVIVVFMVFNFILFQVTIPETKGCPMKDSMPDKSERLWGQKQKPQHLIERVDTQIAKLADQD